MMNSTEFVAADKTKHKFTASNYVGAVVNVNCQCQENGWLGIPKWKTQQAYGDASVVCFFFLTCPTHQAGTVRMDCHYHFEQTDNFTNCPVTLD